MRKYFLIQDFGGPAHGGFGQTSQRKGLCVGDDVGLRLDHGNVDVDDPIWDLMRRWGCHGPLPGAAIVWFAGPSQLDELIAALWLLLLFRLN